jgi:S-formylglutathione hydrolase FrmB
MIRLTWRAANYGQVVFALLFSTMLVAQRPAPPNVSRAQCQEVSSAILHRQVKYCVILPPQYDADSTKRYPVLYYLHGYGDSERTLVQSDGWDMLEQLWEDAKIGRFIVATPDAWNTYYVNARGDKEAYEDFLIREFVPAIESRYRALGVREGRALGGFSMGGYGALRFAFKYPEMFAAVAVHSAALDENRTTGIASDGGLLRAFGIPFDAGYWKENSPFALVRAGDRFGDLKIYFDCGAQDSFGLAAGAQAFHELLVQKHIPHEFHLYPGSHNWDYVEEHFSASLQFISVAFGLNSAK